VPTFADRGCQRDGSLRPHSRFSRPFYYKMVCLSFCLVCGHIPSTAIVQAVRHVSIVLQSIDWTWKECLNATAPRAAWTILRCLHSLTRDPRVHELSSISDWTIVKYRNVCVLHERNIPSLSKSKAISATDLEGLQGCEISRIPHFLNNRLTDGDEVVSPKRRPRSIPLIFCFCFISGTHFCSRLSKPQGHGAAESIR
jgi:hypothetical protein